MRKAVIETSILNEIVSLLNDDDLLNYIALLTWKHYSENLPGEKLANELRSSYKAVKIKISNLVKSIENGAPYDLIRDRLDCLREEEELLSEEIARIELQASQRLTEDHIRYFLYRLRDKDYSDVNCQKALINTFINRIDVFKEKVVISLNYSGENNRITLTEIEKALDTEGVRMPFTKQGCGNNRRTIWLHDNVFIIEASL